MRISFNNKNWLYQFTDVHTIKRVHFLGIWTPFCIKELDSRDINTKISVYL